MSEPIKVGQRLSYDGARCTVRYVGPVKGTKGQWLGVEWDQPERGKHSGEHDGVRYFECSSRYAKAGSFVRLTRPSDKPLGFLEALRSKYVASPSSSGSRKDRITSEAPITFNTKVVEEVGFEKINQKLATLQELRIVLLDGLGLMGACSRPAGTVDDVVFEQELETIAETAPQILELDLGKNLISSFKDVAGLCGAFKKLRSLKLDGNRSFLQDVADVPSQISTVTELLLSDTLVQCDEISLLLAKFPNLTALTLNSNQFDHIPKDLPLPPHLQTVILEQNYFASLEALGSLIASPSVTRVSLKGNEIEAIRDDTSDAQGPLCSSLVHLDLSYNRISSWLFIDDIPSAFPKLTSLRISNNPLYEQSATPTLNTGPIRDSAMTVDQAYMLTLARIPNLQMLNFSNITSQDRLNGELYYLSLIGKELSATPASAEKEILSRHPQYTRLCSIHDKPTVIRAEDQASLSGKANPRSLAARVVSFTFYIPPTVEGASPRQAFAQVPKTFDSYRIKAMVAKLLDLQPLQFKLIWESEEWDPVKEGEETVADNEWDSDDEQDINEGVTISGTGIGGGDSTKMRRDALGNVWVRREVEFVDSARDIGFWIDGDTREARVRVEPW